MAAAAVLIGGAGLACGMTGWRPWTFGLGPFDRLAFGLACVLPPVASLAVAIGRVAAHRFFTPADLDASASDAGASEGARATPELRMLSAILQNTLEQVALATPVYLAAAMLLPERWLGLPAAASILFVVGRVSFARGYAAGAAGRAFGFAVGFYSTVLLLLAGLGAVAARAG